MMELTNADVRYVAKLAKLAIRPEEFAQIQNDLNRVLEYVDQLQALDTESIPPTWQGQSHSMIWRADAVQPSLPVEQAVQNAPKVQDDMFVVPRIMEGGEVDGTL